MFIEAPRRKSTPYLCHLPTRSVGVGWPSTIATTDEVRGVATPGGEVRPALLGLQVTVWGTLHPLPLLVSFPLPVAVVTLLVVATRGPPATWVPPVAVPVRRVFAALDRDASRPGDVGGFRTLRDSTSFSTSERWEDPSQDGVQYI